MQKNYKKYDILENSVDEKIISFLGVAYYECINSVLLNDLIDKMEQFKQQENFANLLAGINPETIMLSIQKLKDSGFISIYHNGGDTEIMASNPMVRAMVWEQLLTPEQQQLYLQIASMYRTIESNQVQKTKG